MSTKFKKTFVLDYSKWRCGDNGINKLGKGKTELLNTSGFMCCLGQFSIQLGCEKKEIKGRLTPRDINKPIRLLSYKKDNWIENTNFSGNAIKINDNENTTPLGKIVLLRKLLAKHKLGLRVINKPKTTQR